jgi:uncharacterized protein YjbI with pentapeptide repeats
MPPPPNRPDARSFSIISPDLPPLESMREITASDLRPGAPIENVRLEKIDLHSLHQPRLDLRDARFHHVRASQCNFDNLKLLDTVHSSCDWANALWNHAHINRCILNGCRMTGFTAADAKFENTRFTNCKLDLTVFHRTEFTSCSFEDCVLHDSSFEEAILKDVRFKNCDLRQSRLVRAKLQGVDLRGSMLQGLQAEPRDVRSILIDPSQAIDLIYLLGVKVQNADETPPSTTPL